MTVAGLDCMMGDEVSYSLPLTPEDEKRIIGGLKKMGEDNLKEGNLWFVISSRWWRYWVRYVGFDGDETQSGGSKPGEIDNRHLVCGEADGNGHIDLHRSLQEGQDYVLVPEDVWNKLIEWYSGGPAIRRRVILQEVGSQKNLVVEVYPLCLNLVVSDTNKLVLWMSKKDTVGKLYEQVSQRLNMNSSEIFLLDYFEKSRTALDDRDRTLEDSQLQMDQDVLVELKESHAADNSSASYSNQLALVPVEPPRSPVSIAGGPSCNGVLSGFGSDASHRNNSISIRNDVGDGYDSSSTSTSGSGAGITGLQNLGNTCFMNSAVQCLVHTPPLVEFFVGEYSKEINRQNPLGMDGELALAFGELLRKLWSSGRTPIAPRAFKGKLARFAPQFSGYNQHDSQELLAFLLDGLHEDLNRVRQKPYIETKEANDRPDDEVADEFWANHKARNDSVIVDICQGQYKSTLVCPDCSKVSVTFDPFMYLSLPLPSLAIRAMTISVFYVDGSQLPVAFTISVPRMGYCSDIIRALRDACCLREDEDLVLAEVLDHKIYKYFDHPYEAVSSIRDEDYLVAFRFPRVQMNSPRLEITHKRNEIDRFDIQKTLRLKLFGTPLITFLPEGLDSPNDIQNAVTTVLSPLLRDKDRAVQNSSSMEEDVMSADNSEPANGCMDQSVSDANQESTSDGGCQFALFIAGHGSLKPVSEESVSSLHGSSKIKVFMHWSDEDLDSYDVSFLENLPEVFKPGSVVKKTRQESVTLFSCLEAFLKEEPLGPDDKWYCPVCKEHQQATKKLDLWRLPEILVVHLKRFSFNRYMKTKLDTFVDFPVSNLDLTKYGRQKGLPQSHIYDLYAISNHYGGMGGGHYTAYVKLIDQNRWYSFDDSHVSPVSENEIKTSAAYVLFYRRVNREAGAQGRHSLSNNQTRRSA